MQIYARKKEKVKRKACIMSVLVLYHDRSSATEEERHHVNLGHHDR